MGKIVLCISLIILVSLNSCNSVRHRRAIEPFLRNNNKFFIRIFMRNNAFTTNILIAYGTGYRINWDTAPPLRERTHSTRHTLLDVIETLMERHGINGEECIRQAACQLAMRNPVDVIDHIMHMLLRKEKSYTACKGPEEQKNLKYNCSFPLLYLSTYIFEQAFLIT